jgi:phage terminase large subunit-like protein
VLDGTVDACRLVRLAAQRHLDDLEKSKDPDYPYRFDDAKADRICQFAEMMVHVKGKWAKAKDRHIRLENWQCFCLGVPFGWIYKSDGMRRFREVYEEIPRKNGKSILGAVIGNYMFVADNEEGSEVYSGATSEKQAWEVFGPARLMAKKAPGFEENFGIDIGAKNMAILDTANKFEPLIGKPGDGASPHCALVDEYHEHKTPDLYDTMLTGMMAREQPMLVVITTAGTDTGVPCYDKHLYAKQVLEGTLTDDSLFCIIYTIDEKKEGDEAGDDWEDFSVWKKANPNYGVSVSERQLKIRYDTAKNDVTKQNILRCKHLNIWSNAGEAWMNMVFWRRQGDANLSINDFFGERCWLGLDLMSKIDIAALMQLFKRGEDYFLFGNYYLPSETIQLPQNAHYRSWVAQGFLTETEGARIDFNRIEEDLKQLDVDLNCQCLAYDPKEAEYLTQSVRDWASYSDQVIEVLQSPTHMSEPMKEFEALVYDGHLWHDNNPVLNWMMGNVVKKKSRGGPVKYYYPTKQRNKDKIDGPVAAIMAMSRAMFAEDTEVTQGFVDLEAL